MTEDDNIVLLISAIVTIAEAAGVHNNDYPIGGPEALLLAENVTDLLKERNMDNTTWTHKNNPDFTGTVYKHVAETGRVWLKMTNGTTVKTRVSNLQDNWNQKGAKPAKEVKPKKPTAPKKATKKKASKPKAPVEPVAETVEA